MSHFVSSISKLRTFRKLKMSIDFYFPFICRLWVNTLCLRHDVCWMCYAIFFAENYKQTDRVRFIEWSNQIDWANADHHITESEFVCEFCPNSRAISMQWVTVSHDLHVDSIFNVLFATTFVQPFNLIKCKFEQIYERHGASASLRLILPRPVSRLDCRRCECQPSMLICIL